jgi:lipoprotein-releasing system ATP-binding protein
MNEPILTVKGLKKGFCKDGMVIEVLKGIDLNISEGDFITIMGPSGAGKSTFLHILATLDRPTEGEVLFKGRDIHRLNEDEASSFRNRHIGFIFQFYHLLQDFSVIENVMLPLLIARSRPEDAMKRADSLLELLGLRQRRNHRPGELSGGEQQRVAIARALVNRPDIILADEPTGNLDRKTGKEVLNYILDIRKEITSTLVMVTHDPWIGEMGERRYTMIDGELTCPSL